METPRIIWSGDRTLHLVVGAGDSDAVAARVVMAERVLREAGADGSRGIVDVTPGSTSVQVTFRPDAVGGGGSAGLEAWIRETVASCWADAGAVVEPREVVIPVCYGGDLGPDLAWLAERAGMSESEAVAAHTSAGHVVRFLGFAPGFAYIAGLSPALQAPRLESPRTRVPAGSVGVAGARTGIYPAEAPGGWRLIGATPVRMFDPSREQQALLRAGDRVRFEPITRGEFDRMAAERRS
ncbi:5-oxoprolinase subunit PxpB [Nodularia spumigena]|uniref:5-oxoprolinase subunit PxpB n=1 Tax=Nodularia spumigena TaxID=70799 RepID=UPI002B202F84|nr:5-oxoprolinase subunit PxpB [Nodularia spumigena]MEA5615113.1 5-oxoprolinase subunit PxpB [Nodularia spumigena UHCC 0040]